MLLLERRIRMEARHLLLGKRVGVFGKGGSGKSTFVVLLSRALCEAGYAICVLDADSTNIGLPRLAVDKGGSPRGRLRWVAAPLRGTFFLRQYFISLHRVLGASNANSSDGLASSRLPVYGANPPSIC